MQKYEVTLNKRIERITKTWCGSAIYCRASIERYKILLQSLSFNGGSGEEAVSDHNIDFEDENIFEILNMSQMLNLLGNELWWGQWWCY